MLHQTIAVACFHFRGGYSNNKQIWEICGRSIRRRPDNQYGVCELRIDKVVFGRFDISRMARSEQIKERCEMMGSINVAHKRFAGLVRYVITKNFYLRYRSMIPRRSPPMRRAWPATGPRTPNSARLPRLACSVVASTPRPARGRASRPSLQAIKMRLTQNRCRRAFPLVHPFTP